MSLPINPNWNFKEAVENLRALRELYEVTLRSFSCFEQHDKVLFMRRTRNAFYSLNFPEWQIDKIWDYMNRFEMLYVLKGIANRQK